MKKFLHLWFFVLVLVSAYNSLNFYAKAQEPSLLFPGSSVSPVKVEGSKKGAFHVRPSPVIVEKGLKKGPKAPFAPEIKSSEAPKAPRPLHSVSKESLYPVKEKGLSPIEKRFNERAKAYSLKLKQIGYDFFRPLKKLPSPIVPPKNYYLGPGDEIWVYVIGGLPEAVWDFSNPLVVDREGKIYLPGLGIFQVWGQTLSETEELLSRKLKTNLYLTLGRMRSFPVYVSGEVQNPGPVLVKGVDTPLEALMRAGGIKKSGSLRSISLARKEGDKIRRIFLDLYALLLKGQPMNLTLRDGDVLFVPPAKDLAAVGGEVHRPGIYEFRSGETLEDLLRLAGGLLPSSYRYRLILERYKAHRELKVQEFALEDPDWKKVALKPGDLLVVRRVWPAPQNILKIEGHSPYPGLYEYHPGDTLRSFLSQDFFFPDTSRRTALLERRLPGKTPEYISFSPEEVFQGTFDLPLRPGDTIRLFPEDFYPPVRLAGCVSPGYVPYHEGLTLREALAQKEFCAPIEDLKAEIYQQEKGTYKPLKTVYLSRLLLQKQKKVNLVLSPGSLVMVRKISPLEAASRIELTGYVKAPGVYVHREGMRLYDLLKAAGGFREKAYPQGLIIFRESVAAMQRARLRQAMVQMQATLAKEEAAMLQAELVPSEKAARQEAFETRRRLLQLMEKVEVTGRIIGLQVPNDLEALRNSSSNILLEPGDRIYVPKEPSSVLVFGEVNNPAAVLYQKGLKIEDYIRRAGGYTKYADIKGIFIIRANGEAFSGEGAVEAISWDPQKKRFVLGRYGQLLAYEPQPGEAIIVPTKIKVPLMWRPLIRDVTQILYQSVLTLYAITNL